MQKICIKFITPLKYKGNKIKDEMCNTYKVTPLDHTSTLNPGKDSSPFAISGGWNAGDP